MWDAIARIACREIDDEDADTPRFANNVISGGMDPEVTRVREQCRAFFGEQVHYGGSHERIGVSHHDPPAR
jgi:hypothetical protein